jgi:hypothetical protein
VSHLCFKLSVHVGLQYNVSTSKEVLAPGTRVSQIYSRDSGRVYSSLRERMLAAKWWRVSIYLRITNLGH